MNLEPYMLLGFPLGMLILAIGGLVHDCLLRAQVEGNWALKYLLISFILIAFFCAFFMGDAVAMYFGLFRLPE